MLPDERELWLSNVPLGEGHRALKVGGLPVCDELAAACTAALLDALVAKEVAVPRRATQEFTGACLLEAFGDGFTCFLHEKYGKEEENIALLLPCKAEKSNHFDIIHNHPITNLRLCHQLPALAASFVIPILKL